jgi:hypothetical protein
MPPCPPRRITATSTPWPSSRIQPQRIGHWTAWCARCGIATAGRLRAFNPATADDLALFAAVLHGEHLLQGFRNREVRRQLFGARPGPDRRRSAQVSRLVKRLHLRGLVAKIPRSRRWRVTDLGHTVLSAAIQLREDAFPSAFLKAAA